MTTTIPLHTTAEQMIRTFIAENLLFTDGGLPVGDEASLVRSGIVDSTGVLGLVLFVEETFGIDVRDEEVVPENFDSVRALSNYIRRKHQPALRT